MNYLLTLFILLTVTVHLNAQTSGGTTQPNQKKTRINKQEKKRLQRGTGQYYGSKDTTPGSPMGTGGAGGDMSGSPEASAIKTDEQASKAQDTTDSVNAARDTTNTSDTMATKKSTIKRTRSIHHRSRTF